MKIKDIPFENRSRERLRMSCSGGSKDPNCEELIMKKKIGNFESQFIEIIEIIKNSRFNAIKSVNAELINLYWKIGEYITRKIESAEWGGGIVTKLADYIQAKYPDYKGYSDKNLWRMKQFYEAYKNNEKLSPLVRQLSWTHNIIILAKAKSKAEREFYLKICIQEKYSSRELERQIDSGYFERTAISSKKLSAVPRELKQDISKVFKDTYVLDFLNLPKNECLITSSLDKMSLGV